MDLTIGHKYKSSLGDKYVLADIEHDEKEVFVSLRGPGISIRRVKLSDFQRG